MYKLINAKDGFLIDQSDDLLILWRQLDVWTALSEPVVITRDGEIRAGNLLGAQLTIDKGILTLSATTKELA